MDRGDVSSYLAQLLLIVSKMGHEIREKSAVVKCMSVSLQVKDLPCLQRQEYRGPGLLDADPVQKQHYSTMTCSYLNATRRCASS